MYRYLPLLSEVGLIDYRGNKSSVTVEGETCTRADGTLIAISLRSDYQAKLCIHDFGTYRDLDSGPAGWTDRLPLPPTTERVTRDP